MVWVTDCICDVVFCNKNACGPYQRHCRCEVPTSWPLKTRGPHQREWLCAHCGNFLSGVAKQKLIPQVPVAADIAPCHANQAFVQSVAEAVAHLAGVGVGLPCVPPGSYMHPMGSFAQALPQPQRATVPPSPGRGQHRVQHRGRRHHQSEYRRTGRRRGRRRSRSPSSSSYSSDPSVGTHRRGLHGKACKTRKVWRPGSSGSSGCCPLG